MMSRRLSTVTRVRPVATITGTITLMPALGLTITAGVELKTVSVAAAVGLMRMGMHAVAMIVATTGPAGATACTTRTTVMPMVMMGSLLATGRPLTAAEVHRVMASTSSSPAPSRALDVGQQGTPLGAYGLRT